MGRYTQYFRSALANANYDRPGPDIKVEPFAPGTVTPAAGILKAVTSLVAARREQANFNLAQQYKQASMYRAGLENQVLEQKIQGATPLTPYEREEIRVRDAANQRQIDAAKALADYRNRVVGVRQQHENAYAEGVRLRGQHTATLTQQITEAKAALSQIDAAKKRQVDEWMQPFIAQADAVGPKALGVTLPESDPYYTTQVTQAKQAWLAKKRGYLEAMWERNGGAAMRQPHLDTITGAQQGIDADTQAGQQEDAQQQNYMLDMSGLESYGPAAGVTP